MAFQSVPETVQVDVTASVNAADVLNTYHARLIGGYSQLDLDSLADVIDQAVADNMISLWANAVTYNGVEVRGLESEVDLTAVNGDNSGPGTVAQVTGPVSVAFAIKRLSGFTGRSARGRVYMFGLPVSDYDSNENFMSSVALADWEDAVDAIRAAIVTEGWVPVIVSRFNAGAKRAEGVTFEWITTTAGSARLDSRRDRMPDE